MIYIYLQIDKLLNARKDLFPTYEKCKVVEFGYVFCSALYCIYIVQEIFMITIVIINLVQLL